MAMNWHELAFLHWPAPASALRPFIPPSLEIDLYPDESGRPAAWLGVVPFTMTGVRARCMPTIPGLSAFHELNMRTYVRMAGAGTHEAYPGVWFFSLDAAHRLAVAVARRTYYLAYFHADMSLAVRDGRAEYKSVRTHRHAAPAEFEAAYWPSGPVRTSIPGTLEHWLTERYCLYSADPRGRTWRADIHHAPWPLQPAEADVRINTMSGPLRLDLPAVRPLVHFARRLDVVAWTPRRVT